MAIYLPISAVCTLLSFISLQYWTDLSLEKITSNRLIKEDPVEPGNDRHALQTVLGSEATVLLLANFAVNVFVLLLLGLKSIFFSELYPAETRKLGERIISYVIYKGIFLPLVGPPTIFQAVLWSTWLAVLCSLKMFQALGRDRLDRLNASPSVTPWTCFRVYSSLLFVITMDLLWIKLCAVVYRTLESSMFLLLFYEPLSIAFETLQAIVVHGFQLLDVCMNPSAGSTSTYTRSKLFDMSAGSLWEWKGFLTRNLGFFLDIMTLLMALGHYVHIWWLHGTAFHLLDVVLFLNIRALLSAIVKRTKGFIRTRKALGVLQGALPDATSDEIQAYDDECAICREPMAKAKRLSCNHLFHLACLRSWLDQGLGGNFACPTCRKPLHVGRSEDEAIPRAVNVSADEQLARQISSVLDRHNLPAQNLPRGGFSNDMHNLLGSGAWRGTGADPSLLRSWSSQALDGAGPSTGIRPVGLGRVQMMMRQLTSVGETHAQTSFDETSWSVWPINPPQAAAATLPLPAVGSVRYPGSVGGLHMRSISQPANDSLANMLAMAETVREVLPHIPDEVIFQDLQRTNSVSVTVNNLLQM